MNAHVDGAVTAVGETLETPEENAGHIEPWSARLLADLGLPGWFDVHTHFMPPRVLAKVWEYFEKGGPLIGPPWSLLYKQPEKDRVDRLRSFGVKRFTALCYPHKPGMAQWLNAWAADFAFRTPGCLRSATFFCEDSSADYVPAEIAAGAAVFKAHFQVGGYSPLDPRLKAAWSALADSGVPVVVHCGHAPVAAAHTGPDPLAALLSRHPDLRVIVAHLGQPDYRAFLDLADRYQNVYLDTTLVFTDFAQDRWPFSDDLLPRLRDVGDRVLLGTDFPNIPHPYSHQVESLVRLGLGDEWLRGVLYENAARLFSVSEDVGRR